MICDSNTVVEIMGTFLSKIDQERRGNNLQDLQVGQLVVSKRGRDAGRLYLVVAKIDDSFVKVSDGRNRPISRTKKEKFETLTEIQ